MIRILIEILIEWSVKYALFTHQKLLKGRQEKTQNMLGAFMIKKRKNRNAE